jgi:hypothetical protein
MPPVRAERRRGASSSSPPGEATAWSRRGGARGAGRGRGSRAGGAPPFPWQAIRETKPPATEDLGARARALSLSPALSRVRTCYSYERRGRGGRRRRGDVGEARAAASTPSLSGVPLAYWVALIDLLWFALKACGGGGDRPGRRLELTDKARGGRDAGERGSDARFFPRCGGANGEATSRAERAVENVARGRGGSEPAERVTKRIFYPENAISAQTP